ncbi:hypothetical protein BpHYR1_002194 [Brachionus plicatilis]|uniref:Uncharacterized protein n=1 Tax=Brachionus plicatilis TaxID=10195 RepID=A0A3M7R202_BRAPC|nr:hypothetical protein BpHYR1_002194 [Brachionus plicatilis]
MPTQLASNSEANDSQPVPQQSAQEVAQEKIKINFCFLFSFFATDKITNGLKGIYKMIEIKKLNKNLVRFRNDNKKSKIGETSFFNRNTLQIGHFKRKCKK